MWFTTLIVVAVLVAGFSVIGITPKGGRPVENTRLMTAARVTLLGIAVVLLVVAFRT